MNRRQSIVLFVAMANLLLLLLFPPYDYIGLRHGNIPTFDGFYFAFGQHPNRRINADFLTLEVIVVLINAGIAWLLTADRAPGQRPTRATRMQRGVLWLVGLNLILVALFPPFENYLAINQAMLPSFEGFYFVFADNSQRQLVTSILYLEAILILLNGSILWLLFRSRGRQPLSVEEIRDLAEKVRSAQRNS